MTNSNRFGDSPATGQSEFIISEYRDHLIPSTKKKDKFICPNCGEPELSINKDGKRYDCYGCHDKKAIAYKLRELNGEFSGTKAASANTEPAKPITRNSTNAVSGNDSITNKQKTAAEKYRETLEFLRETFAGELCFNLRTGDIEAFGQRVSLDTCSAIFAEEYNVPHVGEILRESLQFMAQKNQHDPVKDYLDRCHQNCRSPYAILDSLAEGLFLSSQSQNKPLYNEYLKRWLIGCVARVYEPGCKFDECLVLQGPQGTGKTSFFQIMGGDWFSASMTGKLDKDDLMECHKSWINEWGELESLTAKKYHGEIKHFLSRTHDSFRPPYGRQPVTYPRRSVIVGSVNPDCFLPDSTGNRRFWIIPVQREIDLEALRGSVEDIWGMAVTSYRAGEPWHLPKDFWGLQAEDNENYEHGDYWLEVLQSYLETQISVDVLKGELFGKLEAAGIKLTGSRSEEMRLGSVMAAAGWRRKRVNRGGARFYAWRHPVYFGKHSPF